MKKIASLLTGLLLVAAIAAFAGTNQSTKTKAPKAAKSTEMRTHQASGTITSVNDTSLTLSHKVKGKEEETSFVLNTQTKKEGELKSGERATVHYRMENNQNVATMVKAAAPKMAHATKTK